MQGFVGVVLGVRVPEALYAKLKDFQDIVVSVGGNDLFEYRY